MQGCKARAQEDVPVLEVLLGGGAALRQSSGHHLGAGAVVPHFNQHFLPAIKMAHNECSSLLLVLLLLLLELLVSSGMPTGARYPMGMF